MNSKKTKQQQLQKIKNQKYVHFQTVNTWEKVFSDFKDHYSQWVFIAWDGEKLKPMEWNDKKFIGKRDINSINITKYKKFWTKEQMDLFANTEYKLSKIEGHFYNEIFNKIDNFLEKLDFNAPSGKPFGGDSTNITADSNVEIYEKIIRESGNIFHFNFLSYLELQRVMSKLVMEWFFDNNKGDYIHIIEKIAELIKTKKTKYCQNDISFFKKLNTKKFVSASFLVLKDEPDSLSTLISTSQLDPIHFGDISVCIININERGRLISIWNKTGEIDNEVKKTISLFLNDIHKKEKMQLFFMDNVSFYMDKNKKGGFYLPPKNINEYIKNNKILSSLEREGHNIENIDSDIMKTKIPLMKKSSIIGDLVGLELSGIDELEDILSEKKVDVSEHTIKIVKRIKKDLDDL